MRAYANRLRAHLMALLLPSALIACSTCQRPPAADAGAESTTRPGSTTSARFSFDVVALGRVRGTLEPCGCTTKPLGGLDHFFGLLRDATQQGKTQSTGTSPANLLVIEPGSLLFPDVTRPEAPTDAAAWQQAEHRAAILHERFSALGERLSASLGPTDVASPLGIEAPVRWNMPRVLANLAKNDRAALGGVQSSRLITLGDVSEKAAATLVIGVTAVLDPALVGANELGQLEPPAAALEREVAWLRQHGANLVIATLHAPRASAESWIDTVNGIDVAIIGWTHGHQHERLGATPVLRGNTWIVEPGEQLQSVTRLHLSISVRDGEPTMVPGSAWVRADGRTSQREALERVNARLTKFRAMKDADPDFIARLERDKNELEAALARELEPSGDVWATIEQLEVTCHVAADPDSSTLIQRYTAWVAETNQKRFAGVRPPPPGRGKAGYAGIEACDMCHPEAVEFWRGTVHAKAFQTLVADNKQFDVSCVPCHVTGFRQPGGSEVVENQRLRDVQCEVCHGPGALHIDTPERRGRPHAIVRDTPPSVCLSCHTPEHSDTFAYEAYLRDILGAGHGAAARARLGDGPTGRELRAAGLAKAGGACKKM